MRKYDDMPKIWIGKKMYYVDDDEIQEYIEKLETLLEQLIPIAEKAGTDDFEDSTIELAKQALSRS